MWGALIAGFAYLLLLVRFTRHAFSSGFFFHAGLAALLAAGIQGEIEKFQAGEAHTLFRGRLILFQYGEVTPAGWFFLLWSFVLQAILFGFTLKFLIDAEYKEQTPAGIRPGAVSPTDAFGRQVYMRLHELIGAPESYQEMDLRIAAAFGSFEDAIRAWRSSEAPPESVAVILGAEILARSIREQSQQERERLACALDQLAEDPRRVHELSPMGEDVTRATLLIQDWIARGLIDSAVAQRYGDAILRALHDQPRHSS